MLRLKNFFKILQKFHTDLSSIVEKIKLPLPYNPRNSEPLIYQQITKNIFKPNSSTFSFLWNEKHCWSEHFRLLLSDFNHSFLPSRFQHQSAEIWWNFPRISRIGMPTHISIEIINIHRTFLFGFLTNFHRGLFIRIFISSCILATSSLFEHNHSFSSVIFLYSSIVFCLFIKKRES